ncbi:hypothetical protein KP509_17G018100 [Ceratopteris richardii]|uniref:Uncharacterized protein n=1 Tax=Ceratopteris richardii TaxID=49495 RepID=A0A8T2SUH6_CERRI|nr:hypothetical protein KP509_17G018100 [Ceratopteris richardii]
MEPCPFTRVSVAGLCLRIPHASKAAHNAGVHSSSSPCFCEIKLSGQQMQSAPVPLISPNSRSEPDPHLVAASFYFDERSLKSLLKSSTICFKSPPTLQVLVYTGKQGSSCCRIAGSAELLGKFSLPISPDWLTLKKSSQLHHGWVSIGSSKTESRSPGAELHLNVKVEPDPRYIFEFDGEPEQSPQVVQIQGNIRQPIFTCKFTRERSFRSRNGQIDGWSSSRERDRDKKERKGWLVLIHDLSGSPVAAASMVTPFVPTLRSQRVSRSNPGAWLIMRSGPEGGNSWRPWARLEAWRERGRKAGLGCRFQLMAEGGGVVGVNSGVLVTEMVINARRGGRFLIDTAKFKPETPISASPVDSPHSSGDFYFSLGVPVVGGFVMGTDIQGEGKCSKPHVELAMRHVTCIEDAAVFIALAAAVDLSMDACLPFNKKLGKNFSSNTIIG